MGASDILYIFFVMIILLGVMYSLLYIVKKFLFNAGSKGRKNVNISVISTQPLMAKKFLSVVKIEDKYFVLGISDHSINLIDKLDNFTEDEDEIIEKPKSFLDHLKSNMVRR